MLKASFSNANHGEIKTLILMVASLRCGVCQQYIFHFLWPKFFIVLMALIAARS